MLLVCSFCLCSGFIYCLSIDLLCDSTSCSTPPVASILAGNTMNHMEIKLVSADPTVYPWFNVTSNRGFDCDRYSPFCVPCVMMIAVDRNLFEFETNNEMINILRTPRCLRLLLLVITVVIHVLLVESHSASRIPWKNFTSYCMKSEMTSFLRSVFGSIEFRNE